MGASDEDVLKYAHENCRALISRDKGNKDQDDLRNVWSFLPPPKPVIILIYPGEIIGPAEICQAIRKLESQGVTKDHICQIAAWAFALNHLTIIPY